MSMTGRDGRDWEATHYRTHTLGEVRDQGAQMIGHEVTVAGYAETVRGRGAICFLMLRDGTGHLQACLLYTTPSQRDQSGTRMPSSA